MLQANKIEQVLQYQRASFSKSAATTFVIHCTCSFDMAQVFLVVLTFVCY